MKSNKKILVVEDEAPLLNVIADKLTSVGYSVIKAADGQQGLDLALSEQPDLILLDIIMPVMDGITMLKNLRQNDIGKDIEVVLLTNSNEYKMLAEALEQGARDYLVKSDWNLDDIVKLVDSKLK